MWDGRGDGEVSYLLGVAEGFCEERDGREREGNVTSKVVVMVVVMVMFFACCCTFTYKYYSSNSRSNRDDDGSCYCYY